MVNYYEDEEAKSEPVSKKIYIIINDEKHYIDPDIVKKYNLELDIRHKPELKQEVAL